jgi:hypothetical protein
MGGVADKYGVKSTYATGQISYNFNLNPNDGMRWDFGSLGGGLDSPFASNELICYVSCDNPPDDETSFKQGGGRHSDGSHPKCYDVGIDNNSGATRYRTEDAHPCYSSGKSGGKAGAISSAWIGYKCVKFNKGSYVLLEVYDDIGNNTSAPANNWRKVSSWQVSSPNWQNPPSDHVATIRADKIDEDLKDYKIKWISLRGILKTDTETSTPGTGGGGGGGTTTPPPPPVNVPPDSTPGGTGGGYGSGGGGTGSGDGSGGTGSGVATPLPQEKQILFEQKRIMFRWNINHISGDACGVGKNPETLPLRNIYSVGGDNIYVEGKNYSRCGIYVAKNNPTNVLEKSMFMEHYLRYWKVTMKKYGTSTLPGLIYFRIRDKLLNIVQEIGSVAASSLLGNDQDYSFNIPTNLRRTELGDHFSIEYDGNKQDAYLKVLVTYGDKIDAANTVLFVFDNSKYIYDPTSDLAGVAAI